MAPDGVDFVDEDEARRVLLALLEHVAHAARADAHEHLDEVGAADAEERHVRLTGDGPGEQRLAGARRADQQHALGNLAAQALEFLGVLQELDDFRSSSLASSTPATSLKVTRPWFSVSMGARFAEAHRLAAARLHLAHEEHPHAEHQQHGEPASSRCNSGFTSLSSGLAITRTPLSVRRPTRAGSSGV